MMFFLSIVTILWMYVEAEYAQAPNEYATKTAGFPSQYVQEPRGYVMEPPAVPTHSHHAYPTATSSSVTIPYPLPSASVPRDISLVTSTRNPNYATTPPLKYWEMVLPFLWGKSQLSEDKYHVSSKDEYHAEQEDCGGCLCCFPICGWLYKDCSCDYFIEESQPHFYTEPLLSDYPSSQRQDIVFEPKLDIYQKEVNDPPLPSAAPVTPKEYQPCACSSMSAFPLSECCFTHPPSSVLCRSGETFEDIIEHPCSIETSNRDWDCHWDCGTMPCQEVLPCNIPCHQNIEHRHIIPSLPRYHLYPSTSKPPTDEYATSAPPHSIYVEPTPSSSNILYPSVEFNRRADVHYEKSPGNSFPSIPGRYDRVHYPTLPHMPFHARTSYFDNYPKSSALNTPICVLVWGIVFFVTL